jgi:DNA topoisomerase-1
VDLTEVDTRRHETQPPPRYTEASLIKELEEKGIGRPSTYAAIIGTILERKYVERERGSLAPTELGRTVLKVLLEILPDIFDVGFTASMEAQLDRVESGKDDWVEVVRHFYEPLRNDLDKADAKKAELKRAVEEVVEEKCEVCGKPMVKKWGRYGRFLACTGFPECKNTKPLEEEEQEAPPDVKCPVCGDDMVIRSGRYGRFLACRKYPKGCEGTRPLTLGIKCPREGCDGEIKEKRTRRGKVFYGCTDYPDCRFASWDRPVEQTCPDCGYPILVEKDTKTKGPHRKCPRCGYEGKV